MEHAHRYAATTRASGKSDHQAHRVRRIDLRLCDPRDLATWERPAAKCRHRQRRSFTVANPSPASSIESPRRRGRAARRNFEAQRLRSLEVDHLDSCRLLERPGYFASSTPGNRRGTFADDEQDRIFVLGTVPVHLLPEMGDEGACGHAQTRKDDVRFCQIGKEAICFAARLNAAMRRQSDLVD